MKEFLKDEVKRQAIATLFRILGGLVVGLLLIYYFKG